MPRVGRALSSGPLIDCTLGQRAFYFLGDAGGCLAMTQAGNQALLLNPALPLVVAVTLCAGFS